MTKFLQMLHRDLMEDFGESNMGTFSEMHPLVGRMLEECSPGPYREEKYNQFIDTVCQYEKLKPEQVRRAVPPKAFYDYMRGYAAGIQYAVKKLKAPITIDDYEFKDTVIDKDDKGVRKIKNFAAMAVEMGGGAEELLRSVH